MNAPRSSRKPARRLLPAWWPHGLCLGAALLAARPGLAEIVIKPAAEQPAAGQGIAVPAPSDAPQASREDVIEFLNGDRLHGTLLSLDNRAGVRWQHTAIRTVLSISPASIARITLDRPRATNSPPKQTCGVKLLNSDELIGELVSLDDKNLQLDTWYAGALTIPRQFIGSISPTRGRLSSIYEGPTGLEGWTIKGGRRNDAWRFVEGAFVNDTSGSIGRNFSLPDLSQIDFDLTHRGYLQFSLSVFSDTLERYGGSSFLLQFSHSSVYLQRLSRDGNSSSLGQVQLQSLADNPTSRISIRSNKKEKMIALVVDGSLVKQWSDRTDFPAGNGLVFIQQGQGLTSVSNLRITEWDGKFQDPAAAEKKSKEDLIKLANNDKVSGALKTIKDGKLSLGTAFATLDVPLERVTLIEMADASAAKAAPERNEVRVTLAGQGTLTFALEKWDDRQVIGNSPRFGRTKFLPGAFTQIEFNLDQPRRQSATDEFSAPGEDVMIIE